MKLAAARDFAAREPELPARDVPAWTALLDQVLKEAGAEPDGDAGRLTPEIMARIADAFARLYLERFRADPPADAKALDRQRRELQALDLKREARGRFTLVLGAVEGEFLRRQLGGQWHLAKGPLVTPRKIGEVEPKSDSPFADVVNPFQSAQRYALTPFEEDEVDPEAAAWTVEGAVQLALGRPVLLTNDPDAAKEAVAALAHPDLERAGKLFKDGQGDEAERLVVNLLKEEPHAKNTYLALHVGRLLFEQQRYAALRRLMEPLCAADPPDARKYNLLGLALLKDDPAAAVEQFKNALRCDLNYGPGYLNLAQAYRQTNNTHAAGLCLRRLLRLVPYGPYATDARQRLAALDAPAQAGIAGAP
jgi:tetratricopeptide (TPR) repeat protein